MDSTVSPSEDLRAAMALLRETAGKAAREMPPPWRLEAGFSGEWLIGSATPHLIANARKPAAEWVVLMSPAVAESLAAWLETCANDLADARHYVDEPNSCEHALAFARAILGRAS